jgi:AraC-like DNA-binding protein
MLEKTIYLLTGLLGFITLLLIGFRYKTNQQSNFYLIAFLFLSSLRFLSIAFVDVSPLLSYHQKLIELSFTLSAWPLLYLYFKKLVENSTVFIKMELLHLVVPGILYMLFYFQNYYSVETILILKKTFFTVVIAYNASYCLASYQLLKNKVWNRKSNILVVNKQNTIIKQWTKFLYAFLLLILIRFFINLALNDERYRYENQNHFLWVGALIWIGFYVKILYSPEFLYGYDIIQSKIKEYQKTNIIFDNIWTLNATKQVVNLQDLVLKEKIASYAASYIISIENLALNTNLFLSENFRTVDLANKLSIPKSHVLYLFKYHSFISFADFKKIIRIQKSIGLIEEGYLETNTMESLAIMTGFTSYSSFFKSFKSIIGVSPQEYRRS